jgi:uncharacterized protein YuzE
MRIYYDVAEDAFYLRLGKSRIVESEEVTPGVIADFNELNDVVGVEVLGFKRRLSKVDLDQLKRLFG